MLIVDPRRNSGCDYHRTQLPLQHIPELSCKVPTLFINRDTCYSLDWIRRLKVDGGRFVYDQDDSDRLPDTHPLAAAYNTPTVQQRLQGFLDLADVVTVTTERLALEYRHRTKARIEVVPNALPYDQGQFVRSTDTHTGRPIVWAGGSSHEIDLALLAGVVDGRLLSLVGYQRVQAWYRMVSMFPGAEVVPVAPVSRYMAGYDGHRIALAPLAASDFAACKSNLKILEAGAKGLPIICSDHLPYNTPDMRGVVRFARAASGWRRHLRALLDDPMRCFDEGERLAEFVRARYNLRTVNEHRRQILEG